MKLPGLRLRLATSKMIRQWAQRQLPNGKKISGQILNPKTINYQTLKPEKDGLFCERLFGPVNDSICACGRISHRGQKFCPRCEVEYISSRVRRYRLGYIQLITAVAHIWFFKGSYFSLFLNLPKKKIESLLYCTQNISRTIFPKDIENLNNLKQQKFFLRTSPSADLLDFLSKFSRFWNFEKKKKHLISKKIYSLPQYNIQINFCLGQASTITVSTPLSCPAVPCPARRVPHKGAGTCPLVGYPLGTQGGRYPTGRAGHYGLQGQGLRVWGVPHGGKAVVLPTKKSLWKNGGVKDPALFFGFSVISKMFSWRIATNWFSFVFFLIKSPQKEDQLKKFYPGPPGLINFWGFKSRLFCLIGAQLIRTWLTQLIQNCCNDGKLLEIQIRFDLLQFEEPLSDNEFLQKIQLYRRLKYLRSFRHTQINPASMVLSTFPVLPPDLRPIVQLNNNQIAVSDFNKLYQTVLFRNKRLARLTLDQNFHCLNSEALQYAQRLLQESVDSLIENGKKSSLKSLSDLFKGKKGRFRQNLLGKRVDYSGRSVIVVSPYLKIYECGLPKEIAYELFQPFLLRLLMCKKQAQTILGAKKLLNKKTKFIWNLLKEVVQNHPILLNRAPTLHRLSIQTFQPKLIDGKAILLHPLVCAAFNADFDGDQMGVHIPLCFEARAEAWKITWSQNNLFSVATHGPICSPSQDMILGSSFLTTRNTQLNEFKNGSIGLEFLKNLLYKKPFFSKTSKKFFSKEIRDVVFSSIPVISFFTNEVATGDNSFLWCISNPYISRNETEKKKQKLIEIRLNFDGNFQKFRLEFYQQYHFSGAEMLRKIRTTYGQLKFYENLI